MEKVYTNIDKQAVYDSKIAELVRELLMVCNAEGMPCFVSVVTENNEEGTTYKNDMYASVTNDIFLKDDKFPDFVNVTNGFRTIPPQKIVEVDFD